MRFLITAAVLALPLLDIASLIAVGGRIGIGPTIAAVLLSGVAGGILAEGFGEVLQIAGGAGDGDDAVQRAARDHEVVLIFGLILSVALMGAAATLIARLLHRHRWIAYAGFAIILYVALRMIWDGSIEVLTALGAA